MNKLEKYTELLTEFKKINLTKKPISRTFMQISGYPHFENVCSNILSFFFTTDEEHGFKELFFQSLLESINESGMQLDNVSAEREVYTDNNKRLDILLTNDTVIVGIENKIFSEVSNDLTEYANMIQQKAKGQKVITIILSLKDESQIAKAYNYKNVTYDILFEKVKQNLGNYIDAANSSWIIYLRDFIQTILKLKGGIYDMDNQIIDFIKNNNEDIKLFLNECNEIKKWMKNETQHVSELIDFDNYKNDFTFKAWFYNTNTYNLASNYVIDIIGGKNSPISTIETYIDNTGWYIVYWNRKSKTEGEKIKTKLLELGIDHEYKSEGKGCTIIKKYLHNEAYENIKDGIYFALDNLKRINV